MVEKDHPCGISVWWVVEWVDASDFMMQWREVVEWGGRRWGMGVMPCFGILAMSVYECNEWL